MHGLTQMSETTTQNHVRAEFARIGPMWRNNSGACEDKSGRLVRYGLSNDSAKLNKVIKSSDLIGITPTYAFLPTHGWRLLGVFTALETKHEGWCMKPGDDRAVAQAKFHDIVRSAGGFAGFVTSPNDIYKVIAG